MPLNDDIVHLPSGADALDDDAAPLPTLLPSSVPPLPVDDVLLPSGAIPLPMSDDLDLRNACQSRNGATSRRPTSACVFPRRPSASLFPPAHGRHDGLAFVLQLSPDDSRSRLTQSNCFLNSFSSNVFY